MSAAKSVIILGDMRPPARLLILTQNDANERLWREIFASTDAAVWTSIEEIPVGEPADVIITDQASDADTVPAESELVDAGVIRVGADGPADVTLPADATHRELCLASTLVAKIVRLRREQQTATRQQQALTRLALSDPLTGLWNRRAWNRQLQTRAGIPIGERLNWCLVIVDLDHFKSVNDQQGYAAGDRILKTAAEALAANIRDHDFAARLGGDEFGLLLAEVVDEDATRVVERILSALTDRLQRRGSVLTASAGFAIATTAHTPEQLFGAADQALRKAKAAGRDQSCRAD